ncbi:MAG: hypothetical protein O2895_03945 [Chloroflexi bacterium]|nr:hypothetical protein [Chloroflexota bacterium]
MTPPHNGSGTAPSGTALKRSIPAAQPGVNTPFPRSLTQLDRARLGGYREFLDYFEGLRGAAPGGRRERLLNFNYARAVVEKGAAYLVSEHRPTVAAIEDTPEGRRRASAAERAQLELWDTNDLLRLDLDGELDTAVLGDGAYKVTWDEREQRVVVSAPDVQGLYAWSLGDDVRRLWRVASRYELWVEDDLVEARANPYGAIPFVIYPNLPRPKHFWGISDIEPLRESLVELNPALTQLSRIIELSGNPIAVLENVEDSRDISVQPGAVWELPEQARAYLLDLLQGGGVRLHVDYVDLVYRTLHDLAETPRIAFGDGGGDRPGPRCDSSWTRCCARSRASA